MDAGALEGAVAIARGRRRPVVVLGVAAVAHAAAVRAVLAGSGVPVLTTYQAAGTVGARLAEFGGLFTNAAAERPLLTVADLIIGVGLDASSRCRPRGRYEAPTLLLSPRRSP